MSIAAIVAIIVCAVLFATGMPLYIAFGLGGLLIVLFVAGLSMSQMSLILYNTMNSFILLAAPLFILAGNLMLHGGISGPLINFLKSFVGRVPGGLAVTAVIACAFVGALTGIVPATLAAVGVVMFPAMIAAGYDRGSSGGLLCAASNLGHLIPPSIGFILFGFLTGASVGKLFIAGIMPGLLVMVLLSVTAIIIARRKGFPPTPSVSWRERGSLFIKALPGMFMPIIVLGGIYGGIFTPTESAAVACVYCFVAGMFIKRGAMWRNTWVSLKETVRVMSFILIVIAAAMLLGKGFILIGFPQAITNWVIAAGLGPVGFLLVLTVLIIILGLIMDFAVIMFVVIPLVLPCVVALDINLLHLGVVFVVGGAVGVITPPVALLLYLTAGMFKIPTGEIFRGVIPFLITLIVCLFIVVLFPEISTWLPGTMLGG
jgi:C4-dicarboxylate transporter DctM subunit